MHIYHVCPYCEGEYYEDCPEEVRGHNRRHAKYLKACDYFGGWILPYDEREESKHKAFSIMHESGYSTDEKLEAADRWFWSYFSRSVQASGYNLKHPRFEQFAAMFLNQEYWRNLIGKDLSGLLVQKYGQLPGIPEGISFFLI